MDKNSKSKKEQTIDDLSEEDIIIDDFAVLAKGVEANEHPEE